MRRLVLLLALLSLAAAPCEFTVKRHERHTTTAQKKQVYKRAGIAWEKRKCCVVDHIVPLELGGTDTVDNMQIQTKPIGHQKDLIENHLAKCVCKGLTPLPLAQKLVVDFSHVDLGTCPKEAP